VAQDAEREKAAAYERAKGEQAKREAQFKASGADEEAYDAVGTLRIFWPLAYEVAGHQCENSTRVCLKANLPRMQEAAQKVPAEQVSQGSCGKEIEDRSRRFINGRLAFAKDMLDFLERKRAEKPVDFEPEYPDWPTINGVECTKTLFQCGPTNNVCWVNKVADRLGLGTGKSFGSSHPNDRLLVRSTGTVLVP